MAEELQGFVTVAQYSPLPDAAPPPFYDPNPPVVTIVIRAPWQTDISEGFQLSTANGDQAYSVYSHEDVVLDIVVTDNTLPISGYIWDLQPSTNWVWGPNSTGGIPGSNDTHGVLSFADYASGVITLGAIVGGVSRIMTLTLEYAGS